MGNIISKWIWWSDVIYKNTLFHVMHVAAYISLLAFVICRSIPVVIHENPASTTGVIKILEHIAQYVPNTNDASTGTVVSGDGMSVEKMLHAIRGPANSHTRADRMQWAWPCPQEFHKDILLLQVVHVC